MSYPGLRDNDEILKQIQKTKEHIKQALAILNELDAPSSVLSSYVVFKGMLDADVRNLGDRSRLDDMGLIHSHG